MLSDTQGTTEKGAGFPVLAADTDLEGLYY